MSKYIKADEFERAVMFSDDEDIQDVIYRLRDFPSIEITNCEHCMEWHPREATDYGFCIRWGQYTKGSDYCSYGK